MMRRLIRMTAPLALSTSLAVTAPVAAQTTQAAARAEGPVVELNVMQQVMGDPDMADVSAGVTTRAQTAVEAMRLNAAEMDKVLKRLDALNIPRERVQTSGITLNPQYNYRSDNQTPQFLGYDASNTVKIELRDLDKVGSTLDALVASGANNLNGPMWGLVDDSAAKAQARKAAFDQAFAQARDYARMAGYADVRLLQVSESMGYTQPMQMRAARLPAAPQASTPTPTRPGQVATQVNLAASFELVR